MPLQIRRGTELQRQAMTVPLASGELLYVTDDQRLYVGNGATLGGVQITGYTNEDAVDAVGAALTAGVHTNITFTYSSTQDAAGRIDATVDLSGYQGTISASAFKGSIFADDSTLLVDAVNATIPASVLSGTFTGNVIGNVTGSAGSATVAGTVDITNTNGLTTVYYPTFTENRTAGQILRGDVDLFYRTDSNTLTAVNFAGNLTGNVSGNLTGDVKGSIFGDDSTLLVDAVNSTIPASVLVGTFTGNVIGNVTGNVSGNIETNLISSATSSTIFCDTPFDFQTNLGVEGTLTVVDGGTFLSTDPLDFPIAITAAHDDNLPARLVIRKSRGTLSSPTALNNLDSVGQILFNGHDGTTFYSAASIQARINGAVSTGIVPGELRFIVNNSAGNSTEAALITDQEMTVSGSLSASNLRYDSAARRLIIGRIGRNSDLVFDNRLVTILETAQTEMVNLSQHHDTPDAANITILRTRGTHNAPTAVQTNDSIAGLRFVGWGGGPSRVTCAGMSVVVTGTVTGSAIPANISFRTMNNAGVLANRLVITSEGVLETDTISGLTNNYVSFNTMPVLPTYADDAAADSDIGGAGNRINGMMFYNTALGAIRAVVGGSYTSL